MCAWQLHRKGYGGSQMLLLALQPNAVKRSIDLFKHRDKEDRHNQHARVTFWVGGCRRIGQQVI